MRTFYVLGWLQRIFRNSEYLRVKALQTQLLKGGAGESYGVRAVLSRGYDVLKKFHRQRKYDCNNQVLVLHGIVDQIHS